VQTGVAGAICVLDDEPTASGRHCGPIDSSLCQSQKVSFSIALMIQPESGPVCLLGTEFQKKICWEILVAGSEQGIEAGQVGLRLITKGDRQTTVAKEWSISATSIADGRFDLSLYFMYRVCFLKLRFSYSVLLLYMFYLFVAGYLQMCVSNLLSLITFCYSNLILKHFIIIWFQYFLLIVLQFISPD